MERVQKLVPLAGRILVSMVFILGGLTKIPAWVATGEYMATKGMPVIPLFLAGAIVVELVAGLAILFGFKARWAALLLMAYLLPVTAIFHDFWNLEGSERLLQMISFLKNMSIFGGLLLVLAMGPGHLSFDGFLRRRRQAAAGGGRPAGGGGPAVAGGKSGGGKSGGGKGGSGKSGSAAAGRSDGGG